MSGDSVHSKVPVFKSMLDSNGRQGGKALSGHVETPKPDAADVDPALGRAMMRKFDKHLVPGY